MKKNNLLFTMTINKRLNGRSTHGGQRILMIDNKRRPASKGEGRAVTLCFLFSLLRSPSLFICLVIYLPNSIYLPLWAKRTIRKKGQTYIERGGRAVGEQGMAVMVEREKQERRPWCC
jgi:hypothetical protein